MSKSPLADYPGASDSRILNTIRFLYDSERLVEQRTARYGSLFLLKLLFGDWLIVTDIAEANAIFNLPMDHTASFAGDILSPLVGDRSIFVLNGEEHLRMRKVLLPFFQSAPVKRYGPSIQQIVQQTSQTLAPRSRFDLLQLARQMVMEVMITHLIQCDSVRKQTYIELCMALDRRATGGLFFLNQYRHLFLGLGPWRSFEQHRQQIRRLLVQDIRSRREPDSTTDDLLAALARLQAEDGSFLLDEESLLDQMLALIFAGYETTAATLAWCFLRIHLHAEVLPQVMAEITALGAAPTPDELAALPYLDAVVQESMRLNPVLNLVPLNIIQPSRVGERILPAGTTTVLALTRIHSGAHFPEPEQFRPERFLERHYGIREFIPFGGGVRRCIGAHFAVYQIKIMLAELLRQHRFELLLNQVPRGRLHGIILSPKGGVPVRLL